MMPHRLLLLSPLALLVLCACSGTESSDGEARPETGAPPPRGAADDQPQTVADAELPGWGAPEHPPPALVLRVPDDGLELPPGRREVTVGRPGSRTPLGVLRIDDTGKTRWTSEGERRAFLDYADLYGRATARSETVVLAAPEAPLAIARRVVALLEEASCPSVKLVRPLAEDSSAR